MEKQKLTVVVFACIIAFSLGYLYFWGVGSSAEKIKWETLSRIGEVKTYLFSTDITVHTNGELQGVPVDIVDVVSGEGTVDVPEKKMLFDVTINSTSTTALMAGNYNMRVYLIDDTVYFQSNETTFKERIPDAEVIWKERTQLLQQAKILSKSDVKLRGEEKISGEETYVLELSPPKEELVKYIAEQASVGGKPLEVSDSRIANLSGMVEDFSIVLWVGKNDYLPRKFRMYMNLESDELSRETEIVMNMWDYGKPVDIKIPESD